MLRDCAVFAQLAPADRRALAMHGEMHHFAAHAKIFEEAAPCDGLWVLSEGVAKLYLSGANGRTHITSLAGAGAALDLIAALEDQPYAVSAETLTRATALLLPRAAFLEALARDQTILAAVVRELGNELRQRDLTLAAGNMKRSQQQLACLLIRWSQHHAPPPRHGTVRLPFPVTRQDLASSVGVALETAIRQLAPLEKTGVLRTRRDALEVLDLDAMARAAGCSDCTFICDRPDVLADSRAGRRPTRR